MAVIALLHAFPLDSRMWRPQAEALRAAGHEIVVPDLLAPGAAARYNSPTMEAVAEWLVADMASRGHRSFALAGVSMGGYIAMAALRVASQHISGVALLNTKASADTDAAARNREVFAARVESDGVGWIPTAMIDLLLGETSREGRPQLVSRVTEWIVTADPPMVAWAQRAMAVRPDSTSTLEVCRLPALVIAGEEDALSSMADGTAMSAALGGAPLGVVGRAGHLCGVERPSRVTEMLLSWAERL